MANRRAYRHDMRCPHCGSNWMPKDGKSRGKQTYRCKDCHHRHTPDGNRHYYSDEVIKRTLAVYAEGGSAAAASRAMGIKEATVQSWVKKKPFGPRG